MVPPLKKDEFLRRAREVHWNKYEYVLDDFKKVNDIIGVICPIHGRFPQQAKSHIRKTNPAGCRKCADMLSSESQKMKIDEYKARCEIRYGIGKYEYLFNVLPLLKDHIQIRCIVHNNIFSQAANSHMLGMLGCEECAFVNYGGRLSQEETIERFIQQHGNTYDYSLVKYIRGTDPVEIICRKHGIFTQRPSEHMRGSGCSKCATVKGVKRICDLLDLAGIKYIREHTYPDCKHVKLLKFDFYLPDYNVLIEFDGEQHYKVVPLYGGEDGYKIRVLRDEIKNEYCKSHNIPLLRIRFDADIFTCLFNFIGELDDSNIEA